MVVRKIPHSLQALSLQSLCQAMLQQWENTYLTNYSGYSEHFKNEMSVLLPPSFYDKVFHIMVDSHARLVQDEHTIRLIPSVSALVNSIISPKLKSLNLHSLRHLGTVEDEELGFLHSTLVSKLPYLSNLVEIKLQTSGINFTLPICSDEVMKVIGSTCFKLTTLDVSFNHDVTNIGLKYLIPSERQGCPRLRNVALFECSVTHEGIVELLIGLPNLKFLGYRETGQSLRCLENRAWSHKPKVSPRRLKLVHINNLGCLSRTCRTSYKLECDSKLAYTMWKLCPNLNGLKIRVNDLSVKFLHQITTVTILHLFYNLGTPSSPGNNTIQYLQVCGAQLVQLSLVSDNLSIQFLRVICEQCSNLKCLSLSSNTFNCDETITTSDKEKCALTYLEEFKFKTGFDSRCEHCEIPFSMFNYILHKTYILKEVALTMRNSLLSDSYIQELFFSIPTSKIKKICVQIPGYNSLVFLPQPLNLTMVTVEYLIGFCPELEEIGNLLVWCVSSDEVEGLKEKLQLSNSALVVK